MNQGNSTTNSGGESGDIPPGPHAAAQRPAERFRVFFRRAHLGGKAGTGLRGDIRIRHPGGIAGLVRILAISGERDINQAGIDLAQLPVTNSPVVHFSRRETFNHHRGLFRQGGKCLSVFGTVFNIERHIPLVASFEHERNADTLHRHTERRYQTGFVSLGRFNLHHLCTELGQETGADNAREICVTRVKNEDVVENFRFPLRVHHFGKYFPTIAAFASMPGVDFFPAAHEFTSFP